LQRTGRGQRSGRAMPLASPDCYAVSGCAVCSSAAICVVRTSTWPASAWMNLKRDAAFGKHRAEGVPQSMGGAGDRLGRRPPWRAWRRCRRQRPSRAARVSRGPPGARRLTNSASVPVFGRVAYHLLSGVVSLGVRPRFEPRTTTSSGVWSPRRGATAARRRLSGWRPRSWMSVSVRRASSARLRALRV
jgi:hypothetical protein